ncbi:MAG: S8 family peptidase [Betaproteobacteria bacterium]
MPTGRLPCRAALRVRPAIVVLAFIAAGAPASALATPRVDDAAPTIAGESRPVEINRIVLRLKRGLHPGDGARLSGRILADFAMATGRTFTVDAPTRFGDQVLVLAQPATPAEAKAIVRTLRKRPEVLRADIEVASRIPVESRARLKVADSEVVVRFVVQFSDPATRAAAARNEKLGAEHDKMLSDAAGVALRVVRPTIDGAWVVETAAPVSGAKARAIAAALEATPGIRYAIPDRRRRAHAAAYYPNDTFYQQGYLWNLDDPVTGAYFGVDAAHAWAITVGSPTITAAIVDTGITAHPDLAGRVFGGYDFISDPEDARDGDARDENPKDWGSYGSAGECGGSAKTSSWHGSHVAGTFGATGDNHYGIVGVDWRAHILPVRALGRCGSGSTVDITEGMLWAAGGSVPGVPPNPTPARVINLSIGGKGECEAFEQAAYDEAASRGALVVISAGNENDNADLYSPASCLGVATVVATDPYGYRASYSNYSQYADIAAPGGDKDRYTDQDGVLSTVDNSSSDPSGDYVFDFYQGTSMAAPHVTGVGALMLSVNPSLSPAQMKGIMADTSSHFASDSACRTDGDCGAGIVNAYYAVLESIRMLSVPTVQVIEFYNPSLDHYFIAATSQPDVFALDSGAIPGWTRTGRTFNAYPSGESGLSGVCRFYIPPAKGNSHFYSVSAEECNAIYDAATNAGHPGHATYVGFVYETGSAFVLDEPVDGTCPPTRVAVWRLWNRRVDTNHRYTTSLQIRSQMLGLGYVDEGIVMCALP